MVLRRWSLTLLVLAWPLTAQASSGGVTGRSGKSAAMTCVGCHAVTGAAPTVTLEGPASLTAGSTGNVYTLRITGGPAVKAGMNVAVSGTAAVLRPVALNTQKIGAELTHLAGGKLFAAGVAEFLFTLDAPAAAGSVTIFASGQSCNGTGSTGGDHQGLATKMVSISPPANTPPTVSTAASASPSPVVGTTSALSVVATDNGGEAALTYTWAATGPAPVTFSANGNNAAKNATATFTQAGNYSVTVTIADAQLATATSTVNVTVNRTLTQVRVTPDSANVATTRTQAFTADALDQFGAAMPATVTWTASGGGTINGAGVFTAGAAVGGPYVITATSGGRSDTASVTVINGTPPTVATPASASPSTVVGSSTAVSVLGADDGGEASLVYTWSATGPAAVTFTPNGTNAARNGTATFTRAGSYVFTVSVRDAQGLMATSSTNVTVTAQLAALELTPNMVSVGPRATQAFTVEGTDQFGAPTSAPAVTWSVAGGGTIDATGLFTAGERAGGPFQVTASAAGLMGIARVTVAGGLPPVLIQEPAVSSATVIGRSLSLSVLADDDGPEGALTYHWTSSGEVTFQTNDTNAAKATVVTFPRAGEYTFTVTVRDADGFSTSGSTETVSVVQTFTRVHLTPEELVLPPLATQEFVATLRDQFDEPFAGSQMRVTWNVTGGGEVGDDGVFTARAVEGGPFTVRATAAGIQGTARVTIDKHAAPRLVGEVGCAATGGSASACGLAVLALLISRRRRGQLDASMKKR